MEFIFVPAFWENVLSFLWESLLVSVDNIVQYNADIRMLKKIYAYIYTIKQIVIQLPINY